MKSIWFLKDVNREVVPTSESSYTYLKRKVLKATRKKIFCKKGPTMMSKNSRAWDLFGALGPGQPRRCHELIPASAEPLSSRLYGLMDMGHFYSDTALSYLETYIMLSQFYTFYFVSLCLENKDPKSNIYTWEGNKHKLNFISKCP